MSIGEDLIQFLFEDGDVNIIVEGQVSQNIIPQKDELPAIWFQRSGEEEPLDMGGTGGLKATTIDLECLSEDIDQVIELGSKAKTALHGKNGAFGTTTVQGVFVDDKDDDYVPKGNQSDDGIHVSAMTVKVWHTN